MDRWRSGAVAITGAKRLQRGEQIKHYPAHHLAMAYLKGPRPEGATLSLINPDSPSCYVGIGTRNELYVLSTNPNDYVWETLSANIKRGRPAGRAERDPVTGRFLPGPFADHRVRRNANSP